MRRLVALCLSNNHTVHNDINELMTVSRCHTCIIEEAFSMLIPESAPQTPHKACSCCTESYQISTFAHDMSEPDHRSAVCMHCAALTLPEMLSKARITGHQQATAEHMAHRPGRRPLSRLTRGERAYQRYKEDGGKRCASCWHRKPPDLDHWHVNKGKPDGLQTTCRACVLMISKLPRDAWVIARDALRSTAPVTALVDTDNPNP